MSTTLVRERFTTVAFKIETTPGTDAIAGAPIAADFIGAMLEVNWGQTPTPNTEYTGSLDYSPDIPGGLKPELTFTIPLRGAGTPGTAPDFGRVLRCCENAETVTGTAIGGPTAATAGTTTTLTLAAPFAATAQLYRGMPILLSGDRTRVAAITDYTVGRVATLGHTEATAMGASTLAQVPVNVLYGPTSDETVSRTGTVYAYEDGIRHRFTGFKGNWSLNLTAQGIGQLVCKGFAQLSADPDLSAVPAAGQGIIRPTPPRFVGGMCQLNRQSAQLKTLGFDAGLQVVLPDDPEAAEGFGAAVGVGRKGTTTLDPYMNTTTYAALFTNFRQGTSMPLVALFGQTAGNRILFTQPLLKAAQWSRPTRDGLRVNQISAQAEGPDATAFLSVS